MIGIYLSLPRHALDVKEPDVWSGQGEVTGPGGA